VWYIISFTYLADPELAGSTFIFDSLDQTLAFRAALPPLLKATLHPPFNLRPQLRLFLHYLLIQLLQRLLL
jgi:hypothetical protein